MTVDHSASESIDSRNRSWACNASVAIFGFNRPDCLIQVFNCVRAAKPRRLFLVLDAPRQDHPDDLPKWEACKEIFANVDWPCEVHRNYAKENMDCRWRMTTGISWVFEHVDEAILLEDDCLPHPDFFRFCAELLDRYRQDTRIGMIAGHIAHRIPIQRTESYYFDRFNAIWGWATWRRAWQTFDQHLKEWPRFKHTNNLRTVLGTESLSRSFAGFFDQVYAGKANSWATAWFLSCMRQGFLCIHPADNLITNIGVEGAHNKRQSSFHFVPSNGIHFPLVHPVDYIPSYSDEVVMRQQYTRPHVCVRIVGRLFHLVKHVFYMAKRRLVRGGCP